MPGRRKKRSSRCRKPPLIFSESPVEVSKHFASPVTSATNPLTADIISLNDLHHTTWVSPQFDLTGPPSAPRRRGRRRGQHTVNILRTACSQGNCGTRDMVTDIGIGEIQGCNVTSDIETSENSRVGRKRLDEKRNDCLCSLPAVCENNKENRCQKISKNGKDPDDGRRTIQSDMCFGIDMSLCSLVETNLSFEEKSSDQHNTKDQQGNTCKNELRDPLGNVNHTVNSSSQACHSCTGKCVALAEDTPVHEYNLRVSIRNRRGRLPKVAWDRLIAEPMGT